MISKPQYPTSNRFQQNSRLPVTPGRLSRASLGLLLGMVSSAALAQEAPPLEEVVVIGQFQRSLQSAMEQKRNSASVIEAISAADIGQLPDVAITDSLNRLPGLAQDRDRGNGSQISIRGMGGLLGMTTLNGREVATVEEDRNVRYDQFPAELINAAQVYKTPQAWIPEGGVSGTVNLQTIKPLDYDRRQLMVGLRGSYYELGGDIDDAANSGWGSRGSIAYIDQFMDNTLGVSLGYAGRSQPIATQRSELWNYGDTWHNAQWNDQLGANVLAPWGGSALVRGGEDQRHGVMGAIQWRPSERLEVHYDLFWSEFKINETQRGFDFQIANTYEDQWQLAHTAPTRYTNDDLGEGAVDLLAGTVPLSSLRNLNEEFTQRDLLLSHGLNLQWHGDVWTVGADLAYSATERDRRWATVRTEHTDPGWLTFGATSDRRMFAQLEDGVSLTDPTQNLVAGIEVKPEARSEDEITSFKLDFERELTLGLVTGLRFGSHYSDREKWLDAQMWEQSVTANQGVPLSDQLRVNAGSSSYWGDLPAYLSIDRQAVIDFYFGGLQNPNPGGPLDLLASWNVSEEITAQYVHLDFAGDLGQLPFSGNLGVRAVQTKTRARGHQLGIEEWVEVEPDVWVPQQSVELITVPHKYNDVLPSANLTLELTNDQLLRVGVAKTLARAPVDFMSPSLNLAEDQWAANPGESTSGNPTLNPFRATQFDLAYEWYFNPDSSFSVASYYKDLESFIARAADADTVTYNDTEYTVSRPVNGSGGYIRGFETLYQQAFTGLPAPFNGLGIYANYAYTESNVRQFLPLHVAPDQRSRLTGLSRHVGNLTLWYYLQGFEARASYSYRSDFARDVNRVQGEEGINDSEGYLDVSFSYELNDHYKLFFQVQNVTDSPYRVSGLESNNPAHINKYEEFGRRFLFGVNWSL